MARASGACHVAEITRTHGGRRYRYYLLRRTYRAAGQVKHETLGNLSRLPAATIALIRRAVRGDALVAPDDAFEIIRSRPHGHVAAVVGTARTVGLPALLAPHRRRERDLVEAMIAARLLDPCSKLATARALAAETLESSLGESLGVASADEDDLYAAMDWLLAQQARVERTLARRHLTDGGLVLYDVTSTYFEGRTCPLARFGHSRDGRRDKLQIVFGLLTNGEGCPVAVEVFEGNVGDPKTLPAQIQKLRARFGIARVVLVGDRGMLTEARLREDLTPIEGLDWITALRAPAIQALVASGALQLSLFDQQDLAEITHPDYPGERLIVCKNPLLAEERARKRGELLDATDRDLAQIVAATQRAQRPLRGQARIALRVGKVLGRRKVGKHFTFEITDTGFRAARDEAAIAREAALDGIYVIRTSVEADRLPTVEAVRSYKRLAHIERAFRSLKTVDLHVRPIHHRTAARVRAHVFLCLLAYYVEWHMRRAWAPILFDDDDQATGEALRHSVVAPAQRSPRATAKALTKRTAEGAPVHSFHTLLRDLRTIVKNRIRLKA
ncbi:MAG: IS1634 family transposase, partial [Candidatus Rokuibacteriota bacterium]